MANLFRNYLFGKPNQRDFTDADLPENRVQLFLQVLNVRKGSMVGLNLLYLLIWIPAILWTFINYAQLLVVNVPTPDELRQITFTWLLLLWPLIAITGPFNAGISHVLHLWARDEHSFPFGDFKAGMKENWKQGLLFSALDGGVPLLLYLCIDFYTGLMGQSLLFLPPLGIAIIAAGIWFLAAPIVPVLIVNYRQSLGGHLRNALLMTLAQLPRAIAVRLGTLSVLIVALMSYFLFPAAFGWISCITVLLYAVFLLAFNRLIWASYANYLGEKYLNTKIQGAPTDIGLKPKEPK